jgi:hypothetical protein
MGNQLAIIEQIPLPAPSNPARMPSLPAWLQQRSDELASANRGSYQKVPLLPASLILNSSERQVVEAHIFALGRHLDLSQPFELREQIMDNDDAIGVMIAGLLLKGGGIKLDQKSSQQLTEDYFDALEDMPAWCVREALRKWNRGESPPLDGKAHDFNWRPTPPTLRRLAQFERSQVAGRIHSLQRLLDAVPIPEFTNEHRKVMLEKLAAILPKQAAKPIPEQQEDAA